MLQRLFGRFGKPRRTEAPNKIDYAGARNAADEGSVKQRRQLAARTDVQPEILYFLASDEDSQVRRSIAANPTTPAHAGTILATDIDHEVRADLARRVARLLPELPAEEHNRVSELTLEVLATLASDQLPQVRAIVAEEIKHADNAPHTMIARLAADVEAIVAAPVLEYSPLLSDFDLLELITTGVARGALPAIARRRNLGGDACDAVVATFDVPAIAALLNNPSAQIREETLDQIIDSATDVVEWHEPLVLRPELSVRSIRRIATFVGRSLIDTLVQTHGLDDTLAKSLRAAVEARIKTNADNQPEDAMAVEISDDRSLADALERNAMAPVRQVLAQRSGLSPAEVDKILRSQSAAAVTALTWKAGFNMRNAMLIQKQLASIAPAELLNARGGVDYPLSEDNMRDQLEIFAA